MKLPTLKGHKSFYPQKALCPWCKKNKVLEPHSFAILAGGALLMDWKENSGGPDDAMDAFLRMSWHGAHNSGPGKDKGIGTRIEIARDVKGGQFELYFCSTKCLRSYLNYCVDELEKKVRLGRSKSSKTFKRLGLKNTI